ncbi:Small-conductance mechanosensitive channel [Saliniradius amylolyticus]|uniref:Small-conductance mechanosensitive channel n=1 Tax=Saliniradius amylolyticus TaxID=2183582 RepID=A0A2S2E5C0_9ALTE|nr:mechanosensitive ion channel domain-containing protein [Saliniradius amylolyticus]AWL12858.1 Small-conductance mechanosensitive channel [Saliniradius amylolyticus]
MEFDAQKVAELVDTYLIPWGINLVFALLVFVIGRLIAKGIVSLFGKLMSKSKYDPMLVNFLESILSALLMLVVVVASLDQLGVDTTSLVAVLGAAGLAIGLSLKDSLQNFAAGVMLLVFRPFKAGDYVEIAGTAGSVKAIGIFTTDLITPDNKHIIVPNGSIYGDNITNYSAMEKRRVDMVFGIGYGDDIRKAKQILEELIEADERVLKDPAPVIVVGELGDSSVNLWVRPWTLTSDYWGFKWDFTEAAKLKFDEQGITIPFPQRDVHLYQTDTE